MSVTNPKLSASDSSAVALEGLGAEKAEARVLTEEEKVAIIAEHFKKIMQTLGLDLTKDGLAGTPHRVARMYVNELFAGLDEKKRPRMVLFENTHGYGQMVVEKQIPFFSSCEHHFVPIHGLVHVGYISSARIIGLSKINRLVHYYARRPQVQERLTQQIAGALSGVLDTEDVAVKIDATHFCVVSRGVSDLGTKTSTLHLGGCFRESPRRSEFLSQL